MSYETAVLIIWAFIVGDVLLGAAGEILTWLSWRSEVRSKRRFSVGDPMGFFEYRGWLWGKR